MPSTSVTPSIDSNADFTAADAAEPSRSANPYEVGTGFPVKMSPKTTTKISGNAIVQNSAARSRMKLFKLATVRRKRAFMPRQSRSVRPVRARNTSSSVARRTPRLPGSAPSPSAAARTAPIVAGTSLV